MVNAERGDTGSNPVLATNKKQMETHSVWFKRWFNPTLRRIFKVEICSIIMDNEVVGYGIRKFTL
jgi:hypothetical protein